MELDETEVPTQLSLLEPPVTPFLQEKLFDGCRCWLTAPDFQSSSILSSLTIANVYVHICPFLDETACRSICCTWISLQYGVIGTSLWYYQPWSPCRRRFWVFGTPNLGRSTHHDGPGRIAVLPYAWTFPDPPARNMFPCLPELALVHTPPN
jgi:hypothetical protein